MGFLEVEARVMLMFQLSHISRETEGKYRLQQISKEKVEGNEIRVDLT